MRWWIVGLLDCWMFSSVFGAHVVSARLVWRSRCLLVELYNSSKLAFALSFCRGNADKRRSHRINPLKVEVKKQQRKSTKNATRHSLHTLELGRQQEEEFGAASSEWDLLQPMLVGTC